MSPTTCLRIVHPLERRVCAAAHRAARRAAEPEVRAGLERIAGWSEHHLERLRLLMARHGVEPPAAEPAVTGDLHALHALLGAVALGWTSVGAAARAAGDGELVAAAAGSALDARRAARWLAAQLNRPAERAEVRAA